MTSSTFEIISWKHVSAHMGTYRYFLENQYSNHKGLYTFPHMTLLIILTHITSECPSKISSVNQTKRQVRKTDFLECTSLCSPPPPQQKPSRWDSFRDKRLQRPQRTVWGFRDICYHTCHTPDWLTKHKQPQWNDHKQLWISISAGVTL